MGDLEHWLILKSIRGLGERKIKKLFSLFKSARRILDADEEALAEAVGVRTARAVRSREGVDLRRVEEILNLVEREALGYLTPESEKYPRKLFVLPDPPPLLFYRGALKETPLVAVVGPRRPTTYTLSFTEDTVRKLVSAGYGIVSGGAPGVDSLAHTSAVKNSGYTLCVLGFGLLKARGKLFRRIEESGGTLLSEFLPQEEGSRYTFPKRNRLIAALSDFLILPEAGARSGALITARWCRALGRGVFVHIGIGRSPSWEGCYTLLREGKGELLRDVEDLIGSRKEEDSDLIAFLKTPRSLEEIMEFTARGYGEICALLTELELQGKVRRIGSLFCS